LSDIVSLVNLRRWFQFPNPVNEVAARTVATGAVAMSLAVIAGQRWVLAPLAFGFVARVLAGPRFSPLGRLATQVIVPRLPFEPKLVAGPPKRFAQGIGAVLSVGAVAAEVAGSPGVATTLVAMIAGAATLEAAFGFCLGCKIFAGLARLGVVPASVCEECNDIARRLPAPV
jgi:Domain of unknown function (DUF4395)